MVSNSKRKRNVLNIETRSIEPSREIFKGPSNADAFSALETAMESGTNNNQSAVTQLLLFKRIRDLPAKNK
ncbi:hypothetical protein TNCV_4444331 [Trichonephila clavipes]|nr:hypothetical protein TNCV_4444331 [Trichonephila clavipes]